MNEESDSEPIESRDELEGVETFGDLISALGFTYEQLREIYGDEAAAALTGGSSDDPEPDEQTAGRTKAAAETDSTPVRPARSMDDLTRAHAEERLADAEQDRGLRKALAWWSIAAASSMLLVATYVFVLYVISQWGEVPMGAIIAFLSSTVAEVLGIVILVANYLFPRPKE